MVETGTNKSVSFDELENIRKELKEAEELEFEQAEKIRHLQKELEIQQKDAQWEIDQMIYKLRTDKDAREKYGYTNDRDWLKEIENNLLAVEIAETKREYYGRLDEKIEDLKREKELTHLKIKDLRREFEILLRFVGIRVRFMGIASNKEIYCIGE
jgi:hypothetical protein